MTEETTQKTSEEIIAERITDAMKNSTSIKQHPMVALTDEVLDALIVGISDQSGKSDFSRSIYSFISKQRDDAGKWAIELMIVQNYLNARKDLTNLQRIGSGLASEDQPIRAIAADEFMKLSPDTMNNHNKFLKTFLAETQMHQSSTRVEKLVILITKLQSELLATIANLHELASKVNASGGNIKQ